MSTDGYQCAQCGVAWLDELGAGSCCVADAMAPPRGSNRSELAKKRRFRRSKAELDPSLMKTIVAVMEVGAGRVAAAQQANISVRTINQWERDGKALWERRDDAEALDDREHLFADFWASMRMAESDNKIHYLQNLHRHAETDSRSCQWALEKQHPQEYGKTTIVHEIDVTMSDEQLAAQMESVAAQLREGDDDE